jgi:hypothetical protein
MKPFTITLRKRLEYAHIGVSLIPSKPYTAFYDEENQRYIAVLGTATKVVILPKFVESATPQSAVCA